MKRHIIKLVGVKVGDAQENIRKFGCRDVGTFALVRVRNNSHDPNAIMRGILLSHQKNLRRNTMKNNGKVKWFNSDRGYGFINKDGDNDNDHFVHYSYIQMEGYKTLKANQIVTFDLKKTDKGIHAYNVIPK